jgi:hypothetical protein
VRVSVGLIRSGGWIRQLTCRGGLFMVACRGKVSSCGLLRRKFLHRLCSNGNWRQGRVTYAKDSKVSIKQH